MVTSNWKPAAETKLLLVWDDDNISTQELICEVWYIKAYQQLLLVVR